MYGARFDECGKLLKLLRADGGASRASLKGMAHGGLRDLLKNGGFHAFLWTQFLGAFNDNLYQMLVFQAAMERGPSPALVQIIYLLPFLLFSGYAGHLADAVSKRSVLIGVKVFEVGAMGVGAAAIIAGHMEWMLIVLFLMGLHSTVFSPAKYGIVPEILSDRDLSRANAWLEMTTLVGIVLGTAAGTFAWAQWHGESHKMALVPLAIAVVGLAASFRITRVRPAGAERFRLNPFADIAGSTRSLMNNRPLWLAVLGVVFFWSLGAMLKPNLLSFGSEVLQAGELRTGLLLPFLSIGIGVGNMLAGRLSGDKVELGLVPLGSLCMGVFALALSVSRSYGVAVAALMLLGLTSGLFIVPLYAYMQQKAGAHEKGRIVAANNFYQTLGMLGASVLLWALHDRLGVSSAAMMALAGVATLVVTAFILTVVPDFFVRFVLWMATHTAFRIKIVGQENVPFRGPALLVANHVSYVDGLLIGSCIQRFVRFMVWKPYYDARWLNRFFRLSKAIPVGGGRQAVEAIRVARTELAAGHVVCIFAEGAITRTGNMLPFKRGMEKILEGLDVPVIPVHLAVGKGNVGRKVTVSFGAPMPAETPAHDVRQAIQELSAEAVEHRKRADDLLDRRVIRSARKNWRGFAIADSTGRELTYGRMLTGAVLLSRWMGRGEEMIGVLMPATVAGALVNVGATLAGRVTVNLNFTTGREGMLAAMEQCGIRTVISSKAFCAKAKIEPLPGTVWIEDILRGVSKWAKVRALLAARFLPVRMLSAPGRTPNSVATVIFSSGSTGTPKGVMLSHYNLIANIEAVGQLFRISERDRIAGVLPFFHSFGYTITLWFPLVSGCGAAYHPNPTEAGAVGELVEKYRATLLLATPTFVSAYTRKCTREQFASLRYVLVGAEKLRAPIADAFREKFGLELLEGYGATEMSPVIAVNVPDYGEGSDRQTGTKAGTVGHPVPGVAAQLVDPATFEPLGPNVEGLLLVKGANCMVGYLSQSQRTAEVMLDGWYVTGDIALIDDDGFIRITDRLSRFSKIGGEMVPHIRIEDAIAEAIGHAPCAVTAVPDEQRGERLVAMYVCPEVAPGELWQRLANTELPRLWIPKRENIYAVEGLPLLGTGKLDLRALKERAQQLAGAPA
jgi:acyl-[acyl-carrier-protein]-phospholipid O-acyltransferase/long-chain-fatty-acid--[acyl-carrier-protein] ligase